MSRRLPIQIDHLKRPDLVAGIARHRCEQSALRSASVKASRPSLRPSVMILLIPERNPGEAEAERRNFPATPDSGVIAGDPTACIKRLRAYLRAGVRRILVSIPNVDKRPERLHLAGGAILPALREEG